MKNKKGITIIELIVVITLLSILGTLGFISSQSYLSKSRDSVRVGDLLNISKGLELHLTKKNRLPVPENKVIISSGSTVFTYQGEAGSLVLKNIFVEQTAKDPKTEKRYTYSTDSVLKRYQVAGYLENDESLIISGNNAASADYIDLHSFSKGHEIGVFLKLPQREPVEILGENIDLSSTNDSFEVLLKNNKSFSGTGRFIGGILNNFNSGSGKIIDLEDLLPPILP